MAPSSPSRSDLVSHPPIQATANLPDEAEATPDDSDEPTWLGIFGIGMSVVCGGGLAAAVVWILLSGFVSLDPAQPAPPNPEIVAPPNP